ncbi:OprD family outer membrane porin [Acinetobacter faecalis]|uniref:OprD family outer membrane porin n=1 Tax=Acinetobacter faecalis TaxID=2665161 RepID=A0AB35UX12_9GAMM|nr:OprD family outer membrane porin [Acinetobacter faecalis]MDY6461910.1 OprD family outer membrane porin [Acinetobacter faecalis]MDY6487126.1 OprD family outer membrane porin [Acinetobacter faecalis]MDY6530501.1 OprD family outer membrane porin [Acinetobacter faecalis]MDY6536682.1 OprD family outer membrane porin [Acinetobacter faecalis]MDY6550597.1 OprD family outer membrane porin [Acinetobacter faecalis]
MRHQSLWIAICAATAALGTTATNADFIDDSNVQLKFKNFYLERNYDDRSDLNYGNWTQAITLDAKSGYHDVGAGIQVGADLLAQYAIGLKSPDTTNDIHMPYSTSEGKTQRDNAKIGATLKVKVAQTELKVGDLLPMSPVIFFDPSRQLLTTYSGAWLESKDIKDTKLTLAYIDGINARYDNQYQNLTLFPQNDFAKAEAANKSTDDGMYIFGVDHQFTPKIGGSYWFADVTNIYKQHYAAATYKTKLAEKTNFDAHVRYFDNSETGDKLYGDIDSQAISLGAKVNHGMHTVQLGYQEMFGDHGSQASMFPTLGGWVPQPYLDNWSVASFIRKDEKSWSLGYTYNFKDVGLSGLTATVRHFQGWNVDNGAGKGRGKENENNVIVNYVVPEGKLKGLGFNYMFIDTNYTNIAGGNNLQEHRIATTYTYKF